MQHCLQDMTHRFSATGQELSLLEAKTVDAVSLEVCASVESVAHHACPMLQRSDDCRSLLATAFSFSTTIRQEFRVLKITCNSMATEHRRDESLQKVYWNFLMPPVSCTCLLTVTW